MIKKLFKILAGSIAVLGLMVSFSGFAGAAPAGNGNVGLVDMGKLQEELPEFQRLEVLVKDKESEFKLFQNYVFTQHQNVLKSLKDKADQEKTGKSTADQAAIEKRFDEEVQKKTDETKNQLEQKRNEFMQQLNAEKSVVEENVKKLINKVAEEKKVTVVLDKNAVLYGGTDITDAVIEKGKKEADTSKTKGK